MAIDSKNLDDAFAALAAFDWGKDAAPLAAIDAATIATRGDAALRADLEKRLGAVLSSSASRAAKDYACRKLSIIGTAASVPVAAALLSDADNSHMARYALQRIGGPEARSALRRALETVKGDLAIGMISSLADLADAGSVPQLAKLLTADGPLALAAARALGRIPTSESAAALAGAKVGGEVGRAVKDAQLSIAESRLSAADRAGALALYEAVSKEVGEVPAGHRDRDVRVAAIRGMVTTRDETSSS
ncbi:MAG: hypothetical protein DWI27_04670 [Planctomycetota bacterium]|nr:MAG: hypothetical protein DWI27_04670 [Planctomycetota bacterium]